MSRIITAELLTRENFASFGDVIDASGDNHYPIQDFYLVKVAKRDDGKYQTQIEQKIFDDYQDNYAADCKMQ